MHACFYGCLYVCIYYIHKYIHAYIFTYIHTWDNMEMINLWYTKLRITCFLPALSYTCLHVLMLFCCFSVCDSSKCMCSIGCFGDQSDCEYKYECDPMMCVCPSGMSRVNGRCVKSVTPDDQCTTTVTTTLPTTTRPGKNTFVISLLIYLYF